MRNPDANKPLTDVEQQTLKSDIQIQRKASFSRCNNYRYWLSRTFNIGTGHCVFIGLNPSTADAAHDDPTIRRCMGFAMDWGYSQLTVVNLFAFRTPHPKVLKKVSNPEGQGNRRALREACNHADCIVAAWGADGVMMNQSTLLAKLWAKHSLYCFGETANQQPLHPLYQPKVAELKSYHPPV